MKKMKIATIILFCLTLFLGLQNAFSQGTPLKGSVKSEDGKPIESASITIKGSSIGVVSDASGSFEINASKGDVLFVEGGFQGLSNLSDEELDLRLGRTNLGTL